MSTKKEQLVRAGMWAGMAAIVSKVPTSTVAAAGSAQGDAGTITQDGFVLVTAADGTKGVKLPAAEAGMVVIVKNAAAAILKLYPSTGDKVNGGEANAALSVPASTAAMLVAYDATDWYSVPLLPS